VKDVSARRIDTADSHRHLVQFFNGDAKPLVDNVVHFIDEGLVAGEAVLVIATPEHADAFLVALGAYRDPISRSRSLVCIDAQTTLERFLVDGQPDWQRFERTIGAMILAARRGARNGGLRVYGEMVGILWEGGNVAAAVTLERFWNVVLDEHPFTLFCGYPIDVFRDALRLSEIDQILGAHTTIFPGDGPAIAHALDRAVNDVLGASCDAVWPRLDAGERPAWNGLSDGERRALALREHLPEYADAILARAHQYYLATRTAPEGAA
jgi:hypothetical protein